MPWLTLGVVLLAPSALVTPAYAQNCGDADGSGALTVTDGVQVLRGAAELSSTCSRSVCDVDGSGAIAVTDGVNVLRAAAGLWASLDCGRDPIINSVRDDNGIFGPLIKTAGLVSPPGAAKTVQDVKVGVADADQFVQGRVNTVTVEYDIGGTQAQTAGTGDLSLLVASALDDETTSPRVFELPLTAAKNTLTVSLNVRDDIPVTQFQLRLANGSGGRPIGQVEKIVIVVIRDISPQCGNRVLDGTETCDPPGLRCADVSIPGFCNVECACEPLSPQPTPSPGARFVDNGDGTVTDNHTGLQWEKKTTAVGTGANLADPHDVDNLYQWCLDTSPPSFQCDNAPGPKDGSLFTQFLAVLNTPPCFAGHCDWRIPTVGRDGDPAELETLIETSAPGCGSGGPCIDPIFGPTVDYSYWSATTFATNPIFAWSADFSFGGEVFASGKSFDGSVRAVRNGS